jgi:hypothetical protein
LYIFNGLKMTYDSRNMSPTCTKTYQLNNLSCVQRSIEKFQTELYVVSEILGLNSIMTNVKTIRSFEYEYYKVD